ncbi:MAG: hypothetical protein AUG04_08465 [Deltaproteobacteria bacterium 13_1_20CM_2_69_21]|nr:MAG: hypothetical protein AUG04_08465 [Deltaproteobacteria bacterium 13_1_20CM_2_69_21]
MAQRLRRRVVPPLISALLCGSMVPITGAATAAAEHNAWLVIVTGATTPDGADALLEQYKTSGLPEHGDFPRVIESATIPGLKPGFWIVAAAAPNSEKIAKALASYIGQTIPGAYYRPVTISQPEALRLVTVESTTGSTDELTWHVLLEAPRPKSSMNCLHRTNTCFYADRVSKARVKNAQMRVVLPFVGTAARGDLAAIPYLQGAGAGCHVHVSGKRDDETFTFDAQITTFKRIQLTCDYGGD